MTVIGLLLTIASLVAVVVLTAWWAHHEGFRQGDEPGDSTTAVHLDPQSDGSFLVQVELTNAASNPVVAAASSRWISPLQPVPGLGRTTRRRLSRALDGALVAVSGLDTDTLSWVAPAPNARRRLRLVVDVHVWERRDRLRRHRRVVSVS